MVFLLATLAICVSPPVGGPVTTGFAPVGQYAGHWGVDFGAVPGTSVRAPVSGRVSFSGEVAGMKSVTIEPVPGFKVSVSYLSTVDVARGELVSRGQRVGSSGRAHGEAAVHMSTRIEGRYVDPLRQLGCIQTDITRALRLVTPPRPYPRSRAHGHTRRDLRPDTYRAPSRRGVRAPSGGVGSGPVHACRGALAEGR